MTDGVGACGLCCEGAPLSAILSFFAGAFVVVELLKKCDILRVAFGFEENRDHSVFQPFTYPLFPDASFSSLIVPELTDDTCKLGVVGGDVAVTLWKCLALPSDSVDKV